jgi:hypothetical protein
VGRPRKLTSEKKRYNVAHYYVALCDAADSEWVQESRPYRDDFVRATARRFRTNRRQVERCLVEFKVGRIRAGNKEFLRTPPAKKSLKSFKEMKAKKS